MFSPVLDIARDPRWGRTEETYGEDPFLASRMGVAAITSLQGENFLAPFQAAVQEARVGSVMASYNEIDGVPSHVNHWLLDRVPRQEWGYRGFVTSDGEGLQMLVSTHHVAADNAEAARL